MCVGAVVTATINSSGALDLTFGPEETQWEHWLSRPEKRLPKVATEMALHVLAYNLTRVSIIMGIQPLMAAMRA